MSEKNALMVGFWLMFIGGCFGIVVGFVWFLTGAKTMTEWVSVGLGGAATITASALVAFLRSKL